MYIKPVFAANRDSMRFLHSLHFVVASEVGFVRTREVGFLRQCALNDPISLAHQRHPNRTETLEAVSIAKHLLGKVGDQLDKANPE